MQRWAAKVKLPAAPDGCWEWVGAKNGAGYGHMQRGVGRSGFIGGHRYAYERFIGPLPDAMTIDHLCRNRGCVNPSHLEVVSQGENVLRGDAPPAVNARKTHCRHGHELVVKYRGKRRCVECSRERSRVAYADPKKRDKILAQARERYVIR